MPAHVQLLRNATLCSAPEPSPQLLAEPGILSPQFFAHPWSLSLKEDVLDSLPLIRLSFVFSSSTLSFLHAFFAVAITVRGLCIGRGALPLDSKLLWSCYFSQCPHGLSQCLDDRCPIETFAKLGIQWGTKESNWIVFLKKVTFEENFEGIVEMGQEKHSRRVKNIGWQIIEFGFNTVRMCLGQGSVNFFHKGQNSKHFRLCGPCGICCNPGTLPW